jgi:hypothetical protein
MSQVRRANDDSCAKHRIRGSRLRSARRDECRRRGGCARQWQRFDRNPVFDEDEVRRMVKDGVQRLTEMQLADGGWGWFSGYGEQSWPHTTAVVVHGLQIAAQNDVAIAPTVIERGVAWLKSYQDRQVQLLKAGTETPKPKEYREKADAQDALIYMVLVDAGQKSQEMMDFLYRDRVELPVYARALLGLALEKQGEKDKLAMVLQNISQFVAQDNENQTAYLKLPNETYWWCWWGSGVGRNVRFYAPASYYGRNGIGYDEDAR